MKAVILRYLGQDDNYHDLQIDMESLINAMPFLGTMMLGIPQEDGTYSFEVTVRNGQPTYNWQRITITEG